MDFSDWSGAKEFVGKAVRAARRIGHSARVICWKRFYSYREFFKFQVVSFILNAFLKFLDVRSKPLESCVVDALRTGSPFGLVANCAINEGVVHVFTFGVLVFECSSILAP